ncbi:NAD(P)/FAD-dependent oxidoreductase [Microseira wollei]|uniref:FAD-dependent pyridine nucleotide-disulfide oxidoreductase n=1 Tax=Microseira wollei NIES-4236 TaxID=2530354 RepID=A0AAV3XHR6_9CYAN|nr:NAD(P)/FAD-dependent oxidoreductase [Microseira wollei]GET42128.1 FAD-dependent pyridine nucleotide-disulfide oxidoreductase [Microseira wollei NIES-4236]
MTKICILGGGFGGLYTALYLRRFPWAKSPDCQITLVEQKERFLFTPLLYELVTGELKPWEIAPSFDKLLAKKNIQFCQATIEGVDLKARQVKLLGGERLSYDYLVLAVGGKTHTDGVPGAAQYALPFRTLADARYLDERLRSLEATDLPQIRVATIGGGASGVELACKVADRLGKRGHILLVERGAQILKPFPSGLRRGAYRALQARQIQVELRTGVDAIAPNQITLVRDNRFTPLAVDLVLWTAGTKSIDWVSHLDCQQNDRGQLLTLPTLQLVDYPEVLALGDMAEIQYPKAQRIPATAQVAYQQADCAAHNLKALIKRRPLRHFRYLHLGDMLTLGVNAAVVSSFGINIEGRLASITRQLVYLQRLPTLRHRLQVLWHWIVSGCKNLLLLSNGFSSHRQKSVNYSQGVKKLSQK